MTARQLVANAVERLTVAEEEIWVDQHVAAVVLRDLRRDCEAWLRRSERAS